MQFLVFWTKQKWGMKLSLTHPLRMATSATQRRSPMALCWASSMASTIGTDMLTTEPSPRQRRLKWSVYRNSASLMKPVSGLAHPSLSTCTHSRSIRDSLYCGNRAGPSGASRLTSLPPSGSIRLHDAVAGAGAGAGPRRSVAAGGRLRRRLAERSASLMGLWTGFGDPPTKAVAGEAIGGRGKRW